MLGFQSEPGFAESVLARRWRQATGWLPAGRPLAPDRWANRHRQIVRFALVQAFLIGLFGLYQSFPFYLCVLYATLVAAPAVLGYGSFSGRRTRTISVTVSLMFASATFVDFAHGSDVAHFHFFVMVGVVALYQDRAAFVVCVAITILHHAVLGSIDPVVVYGNSTERANPILWAFIHGAFIAAASVPHLIAWRGNEKQELVDSVTQIPNRTSFLEQVSFRLKASVADSSVVFVDVDNFKHVNDSSGHHVGDRVLFQVAERLARSMGSRDMVARLGGDEFALFVDGDVGVASSVAERIHKVLADPFVVDDRELWVYASIGIADTVLAKSRLAEDLLRDADLAMYLAKSAGKNRTIVYTSGVDEVVRERATLGSELRSALANNQLVVHYQPIVGLDSHALGVEALLRWNHPTRGFVPPDVFIPLAEEIGEIRAIGSWVLRTAAAQVSAWSRTLPGCEDLALGVNVSAVQLHNGDLVDIVSAELQSSGLRPGQLVVEVTESALLDRETGRQMLDRLRDHGVQVALDDFGTGYSSLSYLATFPADYVKIDHSFVGGLVRGNESYAVLKAVLDVASALGLHVVAEGVETIGQWKLLESMGCTRFQGYLFSRAVSAEQATAILSSSLAPVPPVGASANVSDSPYLSPVELRLRVDT